MADANDAIKVAPDVYSVLFENARVRVLDARMKAGAKSSMHSHPDGVWYLHLPATVKFTGGDGMTIEASLPSGIVWQDGQAHAVENVGPDELHALAIELK